MEEVLIASLPRGSSVVFDCAAERTSLRKVANTALDALASRVLLADGLKYLIQPQAVAAMLRGLGFRQIVDLAQSVSDGHLVSAVASRPGWDF
jgi:O-methyltransferase involved in polyketide biosynthesis